MTVTFSIRGKDPRAGSGDGFVVALQNHGIASADEPVGQPGKELGIGRSSRSSFAEGIPESVGVELRVSRADGDAGLEVRACKHKPYTVDNTGANAACRQAISYWKPPETCSLVQPATCCSDLELGAANTCFEEAVTDGKQHELIVQYFPYSLAVFLDDPSQPKIQLDWDIREHISSYVCEGTFLSSQLACALPID